MITATNVFTGEILEFEDTTPEDIKNSWLQIAKQVKALEAAKDQLKKKVQPLLDEKGQYDFGDYVFKQIQVQRKQYDKTVMRQVLDEDTFDLLIMPNKTAIDDFLKENLESLGDISTKLRESMVEQGKPYTQMKLEQVKR